MEFQAYVPLHQQTSAAFELPGLQWSCRSGANSAVSVNNSTGRYGASGVQPCLVKAINGRETFSSLEHRRDDSEEQPSLTHRKKTSMSSKNLAIANMLDDGRGLLINTKVGNEGEDPYRILESGRKVYLDELDVLTLLDPPSFLIPTDASSYSQAAFLWKKIGDIPEERRHRLLDLLTPKHVENMWEIAAELLEDNTSPVPELGTILLGPESENFFKPVKWRGKSFNVPWPYRWLDCFQKDFFLANDGSVYGRVTLGGWPVQKIIKQIFPLYFEVREVRKVIATEEPCNIALEYGDGQLHLLDLPKGFPKPGRHPFKFNDAMVDYLRQVGPGVLVGQCWIEGQDVEKIPEKFVDFVIIKDYTNNSQ